MKSRALLACVLVGSLLPLGCGEDTEGTTAASADAGPGGDADDTNDDDGDEPSDDDSDEPSDDDSDEPSDDDSDEPSDDDSDEPSDDDLGDDDLGDDDLSDDDLSDDDLSDDDLSDDDLSDDDLVDVPEGFIGAAGGIITTEDGFVLVIPEDSIDPEGVVTAEAAAAPAASGIALVSGYFELGPDGTTFDPPASVSLPFSEEAAEGNDVVIYQYDEGSQEWSVLEGCSVDGNTVSCALEHFSGVAAGTVGGTQGTGGAGGMAAGGAGGAPGGAGGSMGGAGGSSAGAGGTGGAGGTSAGAGGTGGASAGSGGTPAGGANSGGSGGSGSGACYVPCWEDIDYASCQPSTVDTCEIVGAFPNITSFNFCYEDGVKLQMTGILAEPLVMSWKKANGDACYSLEITGTQTSTYSYTWKNPGGSTVMTATVEASNTDVVTYQCSGTQYVIDHSDPACAGEPAPGDQPSCATQGEICTF